MKTNSLLAQLLLALACLHSAPAQAEPADTRPDWPGAGQLFAGNKSLEGQEAVIDRVQVSDRMGRTVEVELKGAGLPSAGAA